MMGSDGKPGLVELLTAREQEVLQLLVQGKSNRELADDLVLSVHTVKWYNRQIYGKLGVENREEAVARARVLGLVPQEPQAHPPHNLPLQLSSFVGREQELAEVRRLLSASRLVTLTGAGGCGKTRLALQTANAIVDSFPDGAWLVELAPLSDATLVPQAVALVFDVREIEDQPLLSLLQSYLRRRRLLLVLDNCEHLLEAVAQLAEALLSHCPQLQILATSREALAIPGEMAWLVPTLSLPEPGEPPMPETLMRSDAVRLYVERARAALPGFSLTEENAASVEQVCRKLDGIPLAIELTAARMKLLRVEQIATRLDNRFRLLVSGARTALPRHQTLAALIDWSYELLTPAEQRLLRELSVFAGGFTLEAVEAVCAAADEGEIVELLVQLVNKSLVVAEREPGQEARYRLLETIRQYAVEKVREKGELEQVQTKHLAFFLQLAETAETRLHSGEQLVWLERLEAEHDNLRAALVYSLDSQKGGLEAGLRLATALVPFWIIRSHLREGRRWLDAALERRHEAALTTQARLLCNAGRLWVEEWETDPTALLQESLALHRQLDDRRGTALSLCWLGWCDFRFRRDAVTPKPLWEEGLALARQVDDKLLMSWLYHGLAWIAMARGNSVEAAKLSARGLELASETGDRQMKLRLLFILGRNAVNQRDYERATLLFRETLVLVREMKDRRDEAATLNWLGATARAQRAYEQATAFYHECLALRRELNSAGGIAGVTHDLGMVALEQGDERKATLLFRESMALNQEENDTALSLYNVWGMARVAVATGQMRRAAQLLAVTEPMMQDFVYAVTPVDQDAYARDVDSAHAILGEAAFTVAWAEGQALTLEEAVALALEEG